MSLWTYRHLKYMTRWLHHSNYLQNIYDQVQDFREQSSLSGCDLPREPRNRPNDFSLRALYINKKTSLNYTLFLGCTTVLLLRWSVVSLFEFSSAGKCSVWGLPSKPGFRMMLGTNSIISCSSTTAVRKWKNQAAIIWVEKDWMQLSKLKVKNVLSLEEEKKLSINLKRTNIHINMY